MNFTRWYFAWRNGAPSAEGPPSHLAGNFFNSRLFATITEFFLSDAIGVGNTGRAPRLIPCIPEQRAWGEGHTPTAHLEFVSFTWIDVASSSDTIVFETGQDLQIFKSIVQFVTVDVIHLHLRAWVQAQEYLGQDTMN